MATIDQAMLTRLLALTGGADNILQCGNCMTRLRLSLKDNQLVDYKALRTLPGVLGVIDSDNQLQIVLGPGKAQSAAEMMNQLIDDAEPPGNTEPAGTAKGDTLASTAAASKQQIKAKQTSAAHRFLAKFATIFTPLIPGFIAAGLLLGIATLLTQSFYPAGLPVKAEQQTLLVDLILYMSVFSKGLFSFLSILVGYNTQKAFGGSAVNGAIIASLFVLGYNPTASSGIYSGMSQFFAWPIDPRGSIIGVLIACIFGAWLERQVRKIIPANLDMILTSTITLLLVGAAAYVVIMPLGSWLFSGMSWLFLHLSGNPFGSAILAGLFLIAVMFGVHQGFVPVYFALVDAQGFNSLFPILAMAGGGQVGAAWALYVKADKSALLRNQIRGAIIPGLLGIGEPLIYGVTLPRVKPFITACLGGAAGGFFLGLLAWLGLPVGLNTVFGPSGLVALPLMTSNSGVVIAMLVYLGGLIVSYTAGFGLTYLFGSKDIDLS